MVRVFQPPRASAALQQWWDENVPACAFIVLSALVAVGAAQAGSFALLNLAFNILSVIPGFDLLVQAVLHVVFLPTRLFQSGVTHSLRILSIIRAPVLLAVVNTVVFHPNLFSVRVRVVTLVVCTCLYLYPFMKALGLAWMSWNGEISLRDAWSGWVEVAALGYWAVRGRMWDGGYITAILGEYQTLATRAQEEEDLPYDVKFPLYIKHKGQYRRTKGEWVRRGSSEDTSLLDDDNSTLSKAMRTSTSSSTTMKSSQSPASMRNSTSSASMKSSTSRLAEMREELLIDLFED